MSEQPNYEHSATFASLKGIKETLEGNYTSAQYLETLDKLIDNALRPIIQSTSLFEGFVGQLLGWQEDNRKRKVSFLDRQEFTQLACAWFLIPSKVDKSFNCQRLRIERAALLEFLVTVLEEMDPYLKACDARMVDAQGKPVPIEEQLAYRQRIEQSYNSPVTLRPYILQARHWTALAIAFKQQIVEKYVRLSLMQAQRDYVHVFSKKIRLSDVIQSYNLAVIRAIDKCDARQGVLTTYIRNWFLTARASLLESLPAEPTVSSDSIEDASSDQSFDPPDLEADQRIEHVRAIARLVDPEGYGRAYLGIVESFSYIKEQLEK